MYFPFKRFMRLAHTQNNKWNCVVVVIVINNEIENSTHSLSIMKRANNKF